MPQRFTEEEERQLALLARQGKGRAMDRLLEANMGFVISLAKEYQNNGVDLDDLVSEGNIALMLAIQKWDPDKTSRLVKYAVYDIRKAMEHAVERQGNMLKTQDAYLKSIDAPLRPGHTRSLGETMPQKLQPQPDSQTDDSTISVELIESLGTLSDREREVIAWFYGLERPHLTMAEIGEKLGLKRERVRQIRKKAERKLRKPLRN